MIHNPPRAGSIEIDIIAPAKSWDAYRSKFNNLTLRIFEHSGHSPHQEEPEIFNKELLRWMGVNSD